MIHMLVFACILRFLCKQLLLDLMQFRRINVVIKTFSNVL